MIQRLFDHQWKEATRSVLWLRTVVGSLFSGFLLVLLALNFLAVGLGIHLILKDIAPDREPAEVFNSVLLYFFLASFLFRQLFQRIPYQALRCYLTLPVPRRKLVHAFLVRSFFSFFNLFPLLVFTPVAFNVIARDHTASIAALWLLNLVILILTNSLLTFYLNRTSTVRPTLLLGTVAIAAGLLTFDLYGIWSLSTWSQQVFSWVLKYPLLTLIPVMALYGLYLLSFRFLMSHTYLDELGRPSTSLGVKPGLLFDRFGETGHFMSLELKLLLRNSRPRSALITALFLPLFGLLAYSVFPMNEEFYPAPSEEQLLQTPPSRGEVSITFRVLPQTVPDQASIYLAGNVEELGQWKANGIPLFRQPDGSWERTLSLRPGQELVFKFTLGHWNTQRLSEAGEIPPAFRLTPEKDQLFEITASEWGPPEQDLIIQFNLIYAGILITGALMLIYGQFILAWESSYFEGIISRPVDFLRYFQAKFALIELAALFFYLLSIPYGLFGARILYLNSVLFLYNAGVNSFLLIFLAMFARKRFALDAGVFSTQGKGTFQFLAVFPFMVVPFLIFLPFRLLGSTEAGFAVLALLGTLGLLLNRPILSLLVRHFRHQKHRINAGFRAG